MKVSTIPTLLQTRSLQADVSAVRAKILDAQYEATTGLHADLGKALRGDIGKVQRLEKLIADNERYTASISAAETQFAAVQNTLSTIVDSANEIGLETATAANTGDQVTLTQSSIAARSAFESLVNSLNTPVAGRQLFSGAAVDTPPISSAATVLSDIEAIIAAAPDATTARTGIDAYFAPGGTFETTIYQGSTTRAPNTEVAPGVRLGSDVTAIDPALKTVMANLATIAVGMDASADTAMSDELLLGASEGMLSGARSTIDVQARLGAGQEELTRLRARNAAETFAYEQSLAALIVRDQFDAAVELEALNNQLSAIFATTARIADLSYTNFFR